MGSDISNISSEKPDWYIEQPHITKRTGVYLECSLRGIIGDLNFHKDMTLPLKLTDAFYSKLYEIEASYPQNTISVYFEDSTFLAALLKVFAKVPHNSLNTKTKGGKWRSGPRNDLKRFVSDFITLRLPCYVHAGEALFHCVKECDSMYSSRVYNAYVNAYSEFLRQLVPTYFREVKRARRNKALPESFAISDTSEGSTSDVHSGPDSPNMKSIQRKKPLGIRIRLTKRNFSKVRRKEQEENGKEDTHCHSGPLSTLKRSDSQIRRRRSKTLDRKFFRSARSATVVTKPPSTLERQRHRRRSVGKQNDFSAEILDQLQDCTGCGVEVRFIHKFCPNCGDPLELDIELSKTRRELMKKQGSKRSQSSEPRSTNACRKCKYKLRSQHRFCLNCGEEQ